MLKENCFSYVGKTNKDIIMLDSIIDLIRTA